MRELLMETVTFEHYNLAGLEKIWKHYGYAPLIECVWERLQYVPFFRLYTVSDIERNKPFKLCTCAHGSPLACFCTGMPVCACGDVGTRSS